MRSILYTTAICLFCVLPASATITTQHFDTWAEVAPLIGGGMEFASRGDTASVTVTRMDPLLVDSETYNLWEDNVPRAFTSVYNFMGTPAGTTIDTIQAVIEEPEVVPIDPATNGLLVTLHTDAALDSVALTNLNLTLTGMPPVNIADTASVTGDTHYMLIETDLDLVSGYIFSGSVAFDWSGALPAADDQWFEVAPVVIVPEPSGVICCLLGAGGLLFRRR